MNAVLSPKVTSDSKCFALQNLHCNQSQSKVLKILGMIFIAHLNVSLRSMSSFAVVKLALGLLREYISRRLCLSLRPVNVL